MPAPVQLSKADARRALIRHHFSPCVDIPAAFTRLRSVQFDPIAPVGCNHDLVLQARVPGYKIGDWQKTAYEDRLIYDGWDKQASLVPFEGWPLRRFFHTVHRKHFEKRIFEDHKHAVEAILKEITDRGPLLPKECEFQQRNVEWKGSWFGPNVTKQALRALWHSGLVMTAGRRKGQHLYDLTERVVPERFLAQPQIPDLEARRELVMERHRAMGLVRPTASYEVWSFAALGYTKRDDIAELARQGQIVPVEVEGMKAHATPQFLALLDKPSLEPQVRFVAPLDQLLWDRKMVAQVFDFDYIWEIYVPESKRKWGYYVLPVLHGDQLVARVEFYCRKGILEMRVWHWEATGPPEGFWELLEAALQEFMGYAGATTIKCASGVDEKVAALAKRSAKFCPQ